MGGVAFFYGAEPFLGGEAMRTLPSMNSGMGCRHSPASRKHAAVCKALPGICPFTETSLPS